MTVASLTKSTVTFALLFRKPAASITISMCARILGVLAGPAIDAGCQFRDGSEIVEKLLT